MIESKKIFILHDPTLDQLKGLKMKKSAQDILKENLEAWGEGRDEFPIDVQDARILLADSATVIVLNRENGDGTHLNKIKFEGRIFICSSRELI